MAVTAKKLVSGQLSNTESIIYTAPALTQAIIVSGIFHNTDSVDRTISFYIRVSSTNYEVFQQILSSDDHYIFNERIILNPGDSIVAGADATTVVNYWISGAEIA